MVKEVDVIQKRNNFCLILAEYDIKEVSSKDCFSYPGCRTGLRAKRRERSSWR